MYVKICGLQTPETVAAAIGAGASAVGFVFAPGSPRTISAELARSLGSSVPADVETVGVFRNQPIAEVLATAREASLSTVQLHGSESLADILQVRDAGFRTLRAFAAADFAALSPPDKAAWEAERILLDAVEPGAGETFDASLLAGAAPAAFWLLAGGLNPNNVAQLGAALSPTGVDVSSGVESSRGVKDVALIEAFVAAARTVG